MPYDFALVDVFTDRPFGGNQLAVLTDARGLSRDQMQAIAREFNFAETTFVLPRKDPGSTARLCIFSPVAEMPFAGHPTVGSAAVLARLGLVPVAGGRAQIVFDEVVGPVQVGVTDLDGRLYAELRLSAPLEQAGTGMDNASLAAALGLPASVIRAAWSASVGLPFCFCQLASEADVDLAVLDRAVWTRVMADAWAPHVFFFAGTFADGGEVYARMFAPSIGVDEDPATGSASATLAGCLAVRDVGSDGAITLTIRQGVRMGRPSLLRAGALVQAGQLRQVSVGGQVALFATGTIDVSSLA